MAPRMAVLFHIQSGVKMAQKGQSRRRVTGLDRARLGELPRGHYSPIKLSRRRAKSVTKVNRLQCTTNLLWENENIGIEFEFEFEFKD